VPTYEYECRKCGYRFSEFQRIVDPPIRNCPKCHRKNSVEQIISGGSGLIFKGSGFYTTDYRNKGSSSGSDKGHPEPKKADSGDKK
jgi:putative FmdB family regulatory protein